MDTTAFTAALKELPMKEDVLDRLVSDIEQKGMEDDGVQDQLLAVFDDLAQLLVVIDQTESMRQELYRRVDGQIAAVESRMNAELETAEEAFKQELESGDVDAARDAVSSAP